METTIQTQPMLEINYGTKHDPKLYPLTPVGNNTFVLSNKNIYCDLFHDIELWTSENATMSETKYENFVFLDGIETALNDVKTALNGVRTALSAPDYGACATAARERKPKGRLQVLAQGEPGAAQHQVPHHHGHHLPRLRQHLGSTCRHPTDRP